MMRKNTFTLSTPAMPWLMWGLTVSFFAYQFILRLFPSLMMPQIMQQFSIDATAFGFLSAMYYFGYAGMQIPVAMLLDRFGPRLVVANCIMICSLSTVLFIYTNNWLLALTGRFLIGAASAAGFLGTAKVVSLWFSTKVYAKMIGYTFTLGLLGALYGGKPVNYLLEHWGTEKVMVAIALAGLFIAAVIFLSGTKQENTQKNGESFTLKSLFDLLKKPSLLLLALANLLMVGSLEGFADVWGVTYLTKAYALSKGDAAGAVSFIFIGMLFGGPLLAYVTEKTNPFLVIGTSGFCMAVLFFIMLNFSSWLNNYTLYMLFFIVGIFCCYQVIVFSVGTQMVPSALAGVTVAFLNSINMLGGSFFHTLIGSLLDIFWNGSMVNGVRLYDTSAYTLALLAIPITAALGAFIIVSLKITQKYSIYKTT
jgi:predicted MFS family arabinose efflux permease